MSTWPAQARLALGQTVQHVLQSWTALNLAVAHEWGGRESRALRDQLLADLLRVCEAGGAADAEALSDYLFEFFSDNFNTELSDDSEMEVAAIVAKLSATLAQGDFTYAKEVLQHRSAAPASGHDSESEADSESGLGSDNTSGAAAER